MIEQVRAFGCQSPVEVTGGEPTSQPEACSLLARLCDEGFEVLLETRRCHRYCRGRPASPRGARRKMSGKWDG